MCADAIQPATPNWDALDVELICPRCGYNLRMLTVPRCPECGLEFEWEELIAARRRELTCPLFEYDWRKKPVRSFFGTVLSALIPGRIWLRTSLAIEPRVGPLFVFAGLMLALLVLCRAVALVLRYVAYDAAMAAATGSSLSWSLWQGWILGMPAIAVLAFSAFSFAFAAGLVWLAMQIYQQTFRRGRIRQSQLLRVVVLSWTTLLGWRILTDAIVAAWEIKKASDGQFPPEPDGVLCALTELTSIVLFCVALGYAITVYLRIERGWREAVASCVLVVLAVGTLITFATIQVYGQLGNPVTSAMRAAWPGTMYLIHELLWSP